MSAIGYKPKIDGLRAVAVIGVIAFIIDPAQVPRGDGGTLRLVDNRRVLFGNFNHISTIGSILFTPMLEDIVSSQTASSDALSTGIDFVTD